MYENVNDAIIEARIDYLKTQSEVDQSSKHSVLPVALAIQPIAIQIENEDTEIAYGARFLSPTDELTINEWIWTRNPEEVQAYFWLEK